MQYALIDKDGNIQGMYSELPNILRLPSGSIVNCPAVYDDYEGLHLVHVFTTDNKPSKWHAEVSRETLYDKGGNSVIVEVKYEDKPTIVPTYITRRQAKLALARAGLLDTVKAALVNADAETKINWEDALEFKRTNPFILSIGSSLGLTSEQIDNLFRQASEI